MRRSADNGGHAGCVPNGGVPGRDARPARPQDLVGNDGHAGRVTLPLGWRCDRLKRVVEVSNGSDPATAGDVPVYGSGGRSFKTCGEHKEGPSVLLGRKGTIDIPRYVEGLYWNVDTAFDVKPLHGKIDIRFFFYAAHTFDYKFFSTQTTVPSMTQKDYRNMILRIPPRPEQERIAAFLDEKCATVDKAIEVKRKQLESIAGQRKSLITQSVVFGLGACRSRKTGIEWMPLVNSDWEVVSLKRLLSRKMEYGLSEAAELEDENLPRYIRITDFGDDGELKDDTFRSLPVEIAREAMLQANDVLFARSGATVGKSYIYTGWRTGACFAGYLIRAQTKTWRLNPKFLYYFTKSAAYDAWKGLIFTQATIQNISAVKYGQLKMPVPPVQTQNEIVSYLELKERKFDALAANLRKQIETLAQYRKSLIHEYVTGMRRVVS